jgi:LTXXQ motif family protein
MAPRAAPRIAVPSRPSPRIAAPARSAPSIQRTAPASRAASRIERRQQAVQQRQQTLRARSTAPANAGNAVSPRQQAVQSPRLQQLQSKSRLNRADRRELRTLQRSERQNARRNNLQPPNAQTAQQGRLQQLQSKGRLSRPERRELRTLQRAERQNARQQQQLNQPAAAAAVQNQQPRALRTRAVTAQQAAQGRFASGLRANAGGPNSRFAGRRAGRLAARTAWQLGLLAPYVPWRGPVYWPYAYNDLFYYAFWPEAYDPGYWAYAYDDMFDGMFFLDGAPYAEYAAEGPYAGPDGRITTGSAPSRSSTAPGRITQATRDFCAEQAKGVTAWPLEQIADAVRPTEDQKALLANLQKAAEDAAARFKDACPDAVPMTPPGRLQVMLLRLQATDEAIQTVKPGVQAFYNSLNDEQKARFNEIGQQLGQPRQQRTASSNAQPAANCSGEKAGISNLAVHRIEDIVRPTESQGAALDKLDDAMQKAVDTLREACPNTIPQTPVGRLDVMQKRVEAMIAAANTVRPALEEFYASLNDEQKAKFNRLGRETAQGG